MTEEIFFDLFVVTVCICVGMFFAMLFGKHMHMNKETIKVKKSQAG